MRVMTYRTSNTFIFYTLGFIIVARLKGMSMDRPTAVSLFSSCGIGDSGLVRGGMDLVLAADINSKAQTTHELNHPECTFVLGDIRASSVKDEILGHLARTRVDYAFVTPPCQGFSSAGGRRSREDERNSLLAEGLEVCLELDPLPKAIIIENVPWAQHAIIEGGLTMVELVHSMLGRQ